MANESRHTSFLKTLRFSLLNLFMENTIHYCVGCKKEHEEESWRWHSKKIKGKKVWWCHECIDCYGCHEIHHNDTGGSRIDSRGEICRKWWNSSPTQKQKMKNMSTEEILSGTMHGLPNQFKTVSEDRTKEVIKQERKQVLESLT